jgi:hypothetical protein
MNYSVSLAATGPYEMHARVAMDGSTGGTFHVELDQADSSGPVAVPGTGGNQSRVTVNDTVQLTAGAHALSLVMDQGAPGGDVGNFSFLQFAALPHVSATVGTNPDSLSYTVDGTPYGSPQQFAWVIGSVHTLGVPSPQPGEPGTQYVWTSWSDGGAISQQIHASSPATYTASFRTEYYLTMSADAGGVVTPSSSWYLPGSHVSISGLPDSGYSFARWEGTGPGSYTGAMNPASIQMNGPVLQHARFDPILLLPDQVVLLSPADGAMYHTDTVEAVWHTCEPGVSRYWCEIATDSLFVFRSVDSSSTDTSYTFRQLTASRYWWRVRGGNAAGWGPFSAVRAFRVSPTSVTVIPDIPAEYSLSQNYPNPFNPTTKITFQLPEATVVSLRIFNTLGVEVYTEIDARSMAAGTYTVTIDASGLPSGVYLYQVATPAYRQIRKMLLLR